MANVEHSTLNALTESHEPKGAVSAAEGQVYVADGAASGAWRHTPHGWGYYKDNASAQSIGTSDTKLSIDGAGSSTEVSYTPHEIRGSGALWDTTADEITPIRVGDAYLLRLDLPITAKSGAPSFIRLKLDIGGGATPANVIYQTDFAVPSSVPYTVSLGVPIFCLTTFATNGGQLFLSVDSGTVSVTAPGILIAKIGGGEF